MVFFSYRNGFTSGRSLNDGSHWVFDFPPCTVFPNDSAGCVDWVTLRLARSLTSRGELDAVLIAGEVESNAVKVHVK